MESAVQINTMERSPNTDFKEKQTQIRISKFSKVLCLFCPWILFIVLSSPNSVDPKEMPHVVAFHRGLHCLLN